MFNCCAEKETPGLEVVEEMVAADTGSADIPRGLVPAEPQAEVSREPPALVDPVEEAPKPPAEVPPVAEEPAPAAEEPAQAAEEEGALTVEAATQPEAAKDTDVEEFEIECTKKAEGDPLGLDIFTNKKVFVVTGIISGGMVDRWNSANPSRQVKYGAVVYDVNGTSTGLEAMMQEVVKSDTLKLKVRRHNRYTVTVEKKKILGLDLKAGTTTVTCLTAPTPAAKAEDLSLHGWNKSCPEGFEIMGGDELVEVNGKRGTPQELFQSIRQGTGELKLAFVRA